MEILCIGDPHFKGDNGETTYEFTDKICNLIKERLSSLSAVAVLGDILHRHEKVDLHPFHRAMLFLEKIHAILKTKENAFLYILIGNHDRSNNQVYMTDEHVFNPLKQWKNTIIADKAILHALSPSFNVLLSPYVPPGRFMEALISAISDEKHLTDGSINLVMGHQEFKGAKMNTITSNEGDPWDSLFPLCVSGHIHDYQKLFHNLIYVGTPIQHGYADSGRKTISIFKFSGNLGEYEEERIDLKIKGRICLKSHVSQFGQLSLPLDKFFVKVKLEGNKNEIKKFIASKEHTHAISQGVKFQFLESPIFDKNKIIPNTKLISGVSLSSRLRENFKTMDPEIKDLYQTLFT